MVNHALILGSCVSSVKTLMIVKYTSSVADGKILLSRNDGGLNGKLILVSLGIEAMVEQNLAAMSGSVGNQSSSETTLLNIECRRSGSTSLIVH